VGRQGMVEMRNACKILSQNVKERNYLTDLGVEGRTKGNLWTGLFCLRLGNSSGVL